MDAEVFAYAYTSRNASLVVFNRLIEKRTAFPELSAFRGEVDGKDVVVVIDSGGVRDAIDWRPGEEVELTPEERRRFLLLRTRRFLANAEAGKRAFDEVFHWGQRGARLEDDGRLHYPVGQG